jgi:hypothetical protein
MRKGLSTRYPVIRYTAAVAVVACLGAAGVTAQSGAANGEWGVFGADAGATRYSPLAQRLPGIWFNKEDVRWPASSL